MFLTWLHIYRSDSAEKKTVFESTAYLKCTKLQVFVLWLSSQSHFRVTDEAFLAETFRYGPSTFLRMCSLLFKEHSFVFLFVFIAAGVVQCSGRKTSPRTSTIVQFVFHFWFFEISEHILIYHNLIIGLDSYSRQRFIYLDPFWYISVFESTAYLKCTKLQLDFLWLSLQSHYRVPDEAFFFSRNV